MAENSRGNGGRIDCLPLAWNAATCDEPGDASPRKALRPAGLLIAGKLEESFVEKLRFETAWQVCLSIEGLINEAIVKFHYSY